jgi:hypothetical protein
MKYYNYAFTVFVGLIYFSCSNSKYSDENIKIKAINITNKLDSVIIKTFYTWSFGNRGNFEIFTKNSENADSGFYSYSCFYFKNTDTIKFTINRIGNFVKDFPCNINIDTSKYYEAYFFKINDSTIRISGVSKKDNSNIILSESVLKTVFKSTDPFEHFKNLSNLKDSLKILGAFHRPDIGNFIQFYLSSQHILTYLPDSLNLSPQFNNFWLKEFKAGESIKKNWNLRKLDAPINNG